jgi:hypothetical protein
LSQTLHFLNTEGKEEKLTPDESFGVPSRAHTMIVGSIRVPGLVVALSRSAPVPTSPTASVPKYSHLASYWSRWSFQIFPSCDT